MVESTYTYLGPTDRIPSSANCRLIDAFYHQFMKTNEFHTLADPTPPSRYNSFLLRCWHVGDGELRIKLEHIQSGGSVQVDTYEAATDWLSELCAALHKPNEPP